ncbi:MAG: hypothetical protein KBC98_01930 [Candidatus Pacebacteria bacterium]|nr:hypothetical protein [Candidatus Paceibacterota bacterium]
MKKQLILSAIGLILFSGSVYALGYVGAFDGIAESRLGASVLGAFTPNTKYNIRPSKIVPGAFTFDYVFEKIAPLKGEVNFDLPIAQFDEKAACKELQKIAPGQPCDFGKYRDDKGYPVRENAYQTPRNVKKQKTSLNPFRAEKALASDEDPTTPGLVNCRANTNVTGYFKAYFEDVALNTGVNYDDQTHGPARRAGACQVLQDIATLIKLDTTTVTPDILFMKDPGNLPSGALAAASAYTGSYSVGPDNGTLHKHIVSHTDLTPGAGNFDAFIITNFNGIDWSVDSTLNAGTYDFYSVIYHEALHALGFRGLLPAVITSTGDAHTHGTFEKFTYKDEALAEPFFTDLTELLNVPAGAPSPWFITNTTVYRGVKNIVGTTPDGVRPVYSPSSWQQGSSLSHFDMTRVNGAVYVMNPSIGTNTTRNIHNDEKEVLCHEGYRVNGMTGCEQATPVAVDDPMTMSGTSMCIQPLINDISFVGGNLSIQSVTPMTLQTGDTLAYYTSTNCGSGLQTGATNAKSIKITFSSSTDQRIIKYTNKDSVSSRISFPSTISINTTPSCRDTYNYVIQWGSSGSEIGQFANLYAVATDSSGNVYTTEGINKRIQKFDPNGSYITQWGTYGTGNGQFYNPAGIAFDSLGNIYVIDANTGRIQKFTSSGTYVSEFGSWGTGNGQFMQAFSIAFDSLDNIYVVENVGNRIQKFNSSGSYITQWGTYGAGNGQFDRPAAIAIDSSDNVYVSDGLNHRIQKFTSSGTYLSQWGSWGIWNGQFKYPAAIAIDSSDNVYVGDSLNHRIQKFTSSGTYLSQWGTQGTGNGQFDQPYGIALDSLNNVYVTDPNNNLIQKFSTDCPLSVIANTISGIVYADQNGNASLDTSESKLDGIQVKLFAQGSTTPIQAAVTQNIPHLGEYSFSNLADGTYYIALGSESVYPSITQPAMNTGLLNGYSHVYQVTVSGGQVIVGKNFGVVLTVGDLCPNLTGSQPTIPAGYELVNGQCTLILVDLCPDIRGIQTALPLGYQLIDGQCIPSVDATVDVCPNIIGFQATVPAGYIRILGKCLRFIDAETVTKFPKAPVDPGIIDSDIKK